MFKQHRIKTRYSEYLEYIGYTLLLMIKEKYRLEEQRNTFSRELYLSLSKYLLITQSDLENNPGDIGDN